jgi:PHD/YefM family antitoxin component YafN of YafNO toxin-antitoxin module
MNIIPATTFRNNLSDSIKTIEKKNDFLLLSKKGRITSAVVNIQLFEDLLALHDKEYLNSIKQAREQYEQGDVFTHDEVFGAL